MSDAVKTTVYLDRADYKRLKAIAAKRKSTAAALVREAVSEFATKHGGKQRPRSLGAGHSGRTDLSEGAEKLLKGLGRPT